MTACNSAKVMRLLSRTTFEIALSRSSANILLAVLRVSMKLPSFCCNRLSLAWAPASQCEVKTPASLTRMLSLVNESAHLDYRRIDGLLISHIHATAPSSVCCGPDARANATPKRGCQTSPWDARAAAPRVTGITFLSGCPSLRIINSLCDAASSRMLRPASKPHP
jgi:hypothetical protein